MSSATGNLTPEQQELLDSGLRMSAKFAGIEFVLEEPQLLHRPPWHAS